MADYNFERLNVLLVEDSPFLTSLMMTCLRELGVENIKTATHGGDAIDLLKLMTVNPSRAGIMSVDMIISNWQMSPVDGTILLRWVRRHKESPNRFMPFIMISGHSETRLVNQVRDLGVTEFLAKPFSVLSFAQRIVQVVERPRQFIQSEQYFGPDRRRKPMPLENRPDRRSLIDSSPEVEVIHA